jgi:hypothetical protein
MDAFTKRFAGIIDEKCEEAYQDLARELKI